MVRLSYGMVAAALAALSACTSLAGPEPAGTDAQALVFEAERTFALTAQTKGVKQGFLSVLATDSIVFSPAGIVSGIERYTDAPESSFSLMWWPSEGGGATSGDLYFSTGPFVVAADGEDRGFGQYLSVWQRQDDGTIRLLADHGISLPADLVGPQHAAFAALLAETRATRPAPAGSCDTSLEDADAALNLAEDIHPEAILLRNGRVSTRGPVPGRAAGVVTRRVAVAAAEDLGISAGQAQPASAGNTQTYLRIWQREGCAWTVLIDLET